MTQVENVDVVVLPDGERPAIFTECNKVINLPAATIFEANITNSMTLGGIAKKKAMAKHTAVFVTDSVDAQASKWVHGHLLATSKK